MPNQEKEAKAILRLIFVNENGIVLEASRDLVSEEDIDEFFKAINKDAEVN